MSNFKEYFDALEDSVANNEFVKLTLSKPLKKHEGLLNVYLRLSLKDNKQVFEFKYRYETENKFKKLSFKETTIELEKLLLETFRAGTLFTLGFDLLVMVSKKKQISYRDTPPSFKNKLPEINR